VALALKAKLWCLPAPTGTVHSEWPHWQQAAGSLWTRPKARRFFSKALAQT
jgi:hypothetical protein